MKAKILPLLKNDLFPRTTIYGHEIDNKSNQQFKEGVCSTFVFVHVWIVVIKVGQPIKAFSLSGNYFRPKLAAFLISFPI